MPISLVFAAIVGMITALTAGSVLSAVACVDESESLGPSDLFRRERQSANCRCPGTLLGHCNVSDRILSPASTTIG